MPSVTAIVVNSIEMNGNPSCLSVAADPDGIGQVLVGPVDVLFAEGDYLEPDLVVVLDRSAHLLSDRGIEGPPDLVVEVVSPATAARDRGQKLERYRTYGVPEYWVVDPDRRTMEVWRLGDGAREPTRYGPGDILEWQPGVSAAVLEISVGDLLGS